MARRPVRTLVILLVVVAIALLLRWAGGDWALEHLRSLHGGRGH